MKNRLHKSVYSDLLSDLRPLHPHPEPPAELFHYTSAGGLLEILRSNQIWATNLEFMNDFLEVKYAKELFMDVVRREKSFARNQLVVQFLDKTAKDLYRFTNVFSFYAVSFCADGGDRLAQWRAYAGEGTGYSIGFRSADIIAAMGKYDSEQRQQQTQLIQVVYRRKQQEAIVRTALKKVCTYVAEHLKEQNARSIEKSLPELSNTLCAHLFPYLFSFKAAGFEEEKEWRLVTWLPSAIEWEKVNFRASANFTIPYLSLDLSVRSRAQAAKLPISKIIQGPRVEAEVGMKSLELLMKKNRYSTVQIVASEVPFRYVRS